MSQKKALIDQTGLLLSFGFTDFRPRGGERIVNVPEDFNKEPGRWRLTGVDWVAVPLPPPADMGDIDKQPKSIRALMKAATELAGKTEAEAKAAFRRAWESLP